LEGDGQGHAPGHEGQRWGGRALPLDDRTFVVGAADLDTPTVTFGGFDASGCPTVLYQMLRGLPRVMTVPNSSSSTAVPYRSTARIAAGDAWLGETPAAWMTPVTGRAYPR
jgi:hypothetical protein